MFRWFLGLSFCLMGFGFPLKADPEGCQVPLKNYHRALQLQADILRGQDRLDFIGIFCLHGVCESGMTAQNLMRVVRDLDLQDRIKVQGHLSILSGSDYPSHVPAFDRRLPELMQTKVEGWIPDDADIVAKILDFDLVVIVIEGPETYQYRHVMRRLHTDRHYRKLIADTLRERYSDRMAQKIESLERFPEVYFLSELEKDVEDRWEPRVELLNSILSRLIDREIYPE